MAKVRVVGRMWLAGEKTLVAEIVDDPVYPMRDAPGFDAGLSMTTLKEQPPFLESMPSLARKYIQDLYGDLVEFEEVDPAAFRPKKPSPSGAVY
jgi:hypothetical protein